MIDKFLRFIKPLTVFFSKIGLPDRKITGETYYEIRDDILIGDVLLTQRRYEFLNRFIPSEYTHAGIYVGRIKNDKVCYVLEATTKGVVLTDLVTFLTTKDRVHCARFKANIRENDLKIFASSIVGRAYDFIFKQGNDNYYCFELVVDCILVATHDYKFKVKKITKNKKIYSEETFLDSEKFYPVFAR